MWKWSGRRTGRPALAAEVEPFLDDMGRRHRRRGPDCLPRWCDDGVGDHGGRETGDFDSAADGDRRPSAPERRGAGVARRGRSAASGGDAAPAAGAGRTGAGARRAIQSARSGRANAAAHWRVRRGRQVTSTRRGRIVGLGTLELASVMLGKTRRVHFIGIGGSGMSGIAELLANLGYVVTGSDEKRSSVTARLSKLGIGVRGRTRRRARGRCGGRGGVVGRAGDNPEVAEAEAAADSGDSSGRDARGADATALLDCRRGRARQDDDYVDDRPGARAGRA